MKKNRHVLFVFSVVCFFLAGQFGVLDVQAKENTTDNPAQVKAEHQKTNDGKGHDRAAHARGYLTMDTMPDSAQLLPPPPAEGSAAMAHDMEVSQEYLKLRDTKRWEQAAADAEIRSSEAFCSFSCIIGIPVSEADTPVLYKMLRKVAFDAGFSTFKAKMEYNRPRPFLKNNEPICTPEQQDHLANNGSYPSGHTAVGWAWALVLAELFPEKAEAIIARGRAFGESRMACNVHWYSDVIEGRFMASAAVARLHGEAAFRSDLDTARKEIEDARAKGLKPACNCE